MNYIIYKFLAIIMLSSISLYSQISNKNLSNLHFVQSMGKDTVYFSSFSEDKNIGGAGCAFILKSSKSNEILSKYIYTDSYTLKFIIDDFDNDGNNEVMTFDMDESYYSIRIFKIVKLKGKIIAKTVFKKLNNWLPLIDVPSNKFGFLKIFLSKPRILIFYYTIIDERPGSFILFYDKLKNKYKILF